MREKTSFRAAYLILFGIFLLHLIPLLFPTGRTWGFSHLLFLPDGFTIAYIILALAALTIPFLPGSAKLSLAFVDRLSQILFEHRLRHLYRILFIAVITGLFITFRMPTHFLGDGYALLSNLAASSGTFVKWTEKGITLILLGVQSLFGPQNQKTALAAFQTISVFSGALTVLFFFLIAAISSEDRLKRLMVFLAAFVSGTLLLFFGYVENYPLLWVSLSAYLYFGLRYLKLNEGILWAGILLILGIVLHLVMGVFIPSYLYLIFSRGRGLLIFRKFKTLMIGVSIALILALILAFIYKYKTDLYFENIFLPLFTGKPIDPGYALFCLPHLADIFNQLLLLSPLLPLWAFFSFGNLPGRWKETNIIFLIAAAAGAMLFLFIIDPTLGMARDWDLFSLSAFALTILTITALPERRAVQLRSFALSLAVFLAISTLPYLLTNLSEGSSIAYVKYIINQDMKKSMTTVMIFRDFLRDEGDMAAADSVNQQCNVNYPEYNRLFQIIPVLRSGDINAARKAVASVTPNKFSKDYHRMITFYYFLEKDYNKALYHARMAVQLQQYADNSYLLLAMAYNMGGQWAEAIKALQQGYQLNSRNQEILSQLSFDFFDIGRTDSSLCYSRKMLDLDSTNPTAYYLMAKCYARTGNRQKAQDATRQYLRYGTKDPMFQTRLSELQ